MILNRNSTSARLYKWFYSINELPNNLCPYFWKLILMWLCIIPYSVLTLPAIVLERTIKERYGIIERLGMTAIFCLAIICLTALITPIIYLFILW